jgi:hypothetical protein
LIRFAAGPKVAAIRHKNIRKAKQGKGGHMNAKITGFPWKLVLVIVAVAVLPALIGCGTGDPLQAQDPPAQPCSIKTVVGSWVFASDVGTILGVGNVTAVGTLEIKADGTGHGRFAFSTNFGESGSFEDSTFDETLTVNPDCTAVAVVTDSQGGPPRTDNLVISRDGREMRGMVVDPADFLWTFKLERVHEPL